MNIIADRLFALLLGWTGSLFNGLWNLITNESAGVAGFLQRFWLPLMIILLLFGTFMDYLVWLIRWRPYFAWRAWFAQRASHRMMNATQHYMEDLDHLPLDLPEYQQETGLMPEQSFNPQDEPVYFDFIPQQNLAWHNQPELVQQGWTDQEDLVQGEINQDQLFQEEAFIPVLPWETLVQEPMSAEAKIDSESPTLAGQGLQLPAGNMEVRFQPTLPLEQSLPWLTEEGSAKVGEATAPARRRRSESRKSRSHGLIRTFREAILTPQEEGQGQSLLPPPITQEEAYHQPYYPQNYVFRAPQQPLQQPSQTPPYAATYDETPPQGEQGQG